MKLCSKLLEVLLPLIAFSALTSTIQHQVEFGLAHVEPLVPKGFSKSRYYYSFLYSIIAEKFVVIEK